MTRIDRAITLYLAFPLARFLGPRPGTRVPILCYHSISENLLGKYHPYFQINTSAPVFSRQMRMLRHWGYRTLDLAEAWAGLESGLDLSKTVVITFDDGYRDFYTDALDVMKQCGFTATIFLTTDRIQNRPSRIEGVDYLTWSEVRELHDEGMSFGSHTVTHPDLRSLGPEQIEYELGCSKETIEQKLGTPVQSFAYPFAFPEEDRRFTRYLEEVLSNSGFDYGVSTILNRACRTSNKLFLPRIPINNWDDRSLFRAKVEGGYDWLHLLQFMKKSLLHNVSLMEKATKLEATDNLF
jgi:peptidoglycan/xylan/chitin deacetylase (PgdA/CDA1 family)